MGNGDIAASGNDEPKRAASLLAIADKKLEASWRITEPFERLFEPMESMLHEYSEWLFSPGHRAPTATKLRINATTMQRYRDDLGEMMRLQYESAILFSNIFERNGGDAPQNIKDALTILVLSSRLFDQVSRFSHTVTDTAEIVVAAMPRNSQASNYAIHIIEEFERRQNQEEPAEPLKLAAPKDASKGISPG